MSHPVALDADMMRSSSFDSTAKLRFNFKYKVAEIFAKQGKGRQKSGKQMGKTNFHIFFVAIYALLCGKKLTRTLPVWRKMTNIRYACILVLLFSKQEPMC